MRAAAPLLALAPGGPSSWENDVNPDRIDALVARAGDAAASGRPLPIASPAAAAREADLQEAATLRATDHIEQNGVHLDLSCACALTLTNGSPG